jgi:hypothetical protein
MKQAVVDRVEGHIAVLLVDHLPLNVPLDELPRGTKEGSYLQVEIRDGEIVSAMLDEQATNAARARIEAKLERLRQGKHRRE